MKFRFFLKLILSLSAFYLFGNNQNNSLVGEVAPNWVLKSNSGKMEFLNDYSSLEGKSIRKGGVKVGMYL